MKRPIDDVWLDATSRILTKASDAEVRPVVPVPPSLLALAPTRSAQDPLSALQARMRLRDSQHLLGRLREACASNPTDEELATLMIDAESRIDDEMKVLRLHEASPPPCAERSSRVLQRVREERAKGILAVHVRLVDAHRLSVDELQRIPGLTLLLPCWICLSELLRRPSDVHRVLTFVRDRHTPEVRYRELALCKVIEPANLSTFPWAQNIPAWQWALVAASCAEGRSGPEAIRFLQQLGAPTHFGQAVTEGLQKKWHGKQ